MYTLFKKTYYTDMMLILYFEDFVVVSLLFQNQIIAWSIYPWALLKEIMSQRKNKTIIAHPHTYLYVLDESIHSYLEKIICFLFERIKMKNLLVS